VNVRVLSLGEICSNIEISNQISNRVNEKKLVFKIHKMDSAKRRVLPRLLNGRMHLIW